MSNKGTELNKFELFRLIKKLEREKTSPSLKEEITQILKENHVTSMDYPTIREYYWCKNLFARRETKYSTKRHRLGFQQTTQKYVLF